MMNEIILTFVMLDGSLPSTAICRVEYEGEPLAVIRALADAATQEQFGFKVVACENLVAGGA